MNKQLLSMLICPQCQGELKFDNQAAELICTFDGLAFAVRDGVPVMLVGEARVLSADEKLAKANAVSASSSS